MWIDCTLIFRKSSKFIRLWVYLNMVNRQKRGHTGRQASSPHAHAHAHWVTTCRVFRHRDRLYPHNSINSQWALISLIWLQPTLPLPGLPVSLSVRPSVILSAQMKRCVPVSLDLTLTSVESNSNSLPPGSYSCRWWHLTGTEERFIAAVYST